MITMTTMRRGCVGSGWPQNGEEEKKPKKVKKPKPNKVKKPKVTVAEAATKIEVEDLSALLIKLPEFENKNVYVMMFADFFSKAFKSVTSTQFLWIKMFKESPLAKIADAFFAEHPELADNDFYITGEPYAGHYIPDFASRVHKGNKAKEGIHINLKGFSIGNGLTDPGIQYKSYTDYALDNGVISKTDYCRINKVLPVCEMAIKLEKFLHEATPLGHTNTDPPRIRFH